MNALGHQKPVESYEGFYGLNEPPFSLAPNPRFVYESASHAAALAQVAYSLERREPLVVITGEIGAGKTLLCRTVVQRIQRKTFLSVISDPQLDRDDLLKQLLEDFGVMSRDRRNVGQTTRHELFNTLQNFLVSLVPLQAHAVVVIDEAQHLQPEVLEQIRLLSNIDDARGTLLQIILVGQTDLEPLLTRPELRQFQQRVSRRFRLDPLRGDEVQQYIEHRLAVASGTPHSKLPGASDLEREVAAWGIAKPSTAVFTPDAIGAIGQLSGGLPRVINIVCDRALEIAHGVRSRKVDGKIIRSAASVVGLAEPGHWVPPTITPLPRAVTAPLLPDPAEPAGEEAGIEASEPLGGTRKPLPVAFGASAQTVEPRRPPKWLVVGVPMVFVAGFALWFGLRAMDGPSHEIQRPASPPAVAPATPPPAQTAPAEPLLPDAPASAAPAPTIAGQPVSTLPRAAAASEAFEIVIASFRTEARAAAVAGQVTALNLPARQRTADGWQQVLAGPFASRVDADAARQRLDAAGLTGAQIIPVSR